MRKRKLGPETQVAVVLFVAVLFCVGLFGLFTIRWTRAALIDAKAEKLEAVADARAAEINSVISGYRDSARLIATRSSVQELMAAHNEAPSPDLQDDISVILADVVSGSSEVIRSVSIVDESGMVIAADEPALVGNPAKTASTTSLWTRSVVSTELQSSVTGSGLEILVLAAIRSGGETIGLVEVDIITTALGVTVRSSGFGKTGEIVVGVVDVDSDTAHFVTPTSGSGGITDSELAPMSATDVIMVRALRGEQGVFTHEVIDYDGIPVVAATRFLPSTGWALVAKIDRAEVLAQTDTVTDYVHILSLSLAGIAIAASILTRRLTRSALTGRQQADARFASMFTSSPVALLLVDADGKIALANERATTLLELDADDLVGRNVDSLVPQRSRASHAGLRKDFIESPIAKVMGSNQDVVAMTASGREIPVAISLTPVKSDGESMVVTAIVDLTERMEAQEALERRTVEVARANQDLEKINQELDAFASAAAHDLKAPVRAMDSLADFVLEDSGHLISENSRNDLKLIQQRSRRLMGLIDGLLEYSRIGHQHDLSTWIETEAMIDRIADLYVPADRFTVAKLGSFPDLFAPAPAVELVLRNLLANVVKHHDRDHGRIEIGCAPEPGHLCFTLADDGPGIPEKYFERVFQLFKTLERRDVKDTSGIGLTLVKKTVEVHGGTIELVDDGRDRGATFKIRWPAVDAMGRTTIRDHETEASYA